MRVAFVTDEHPTTHPRAGGLATYVARTTRLLASRGYEVHVFVPSRFARVEDDGGVTVHTVAPESNVLSRLSSLAAKSWKLRKFGVDTIFRELGTSLAVARTVQGFEETHGHFDWVQSADYNFRGLFISRRRRPHLVRCSWARDLFETVDGLGHLPVNRLAAFFERLAIRRASVAYAPSALVSSHYRQVFGIDVEVLRPPLDESPPGVVPGDLADLSGRYLVHFGQVSRRKGTDFVLEAAALLASQGHEIAIRIAGVDHTGLLRAAALPPGVRHVGALTRPQVKALVSAACASVLPSRVDNLPNTAIESLSLGTPVITMQASSIDELVSAGVNGWVVPQGNVEMLAAAMYSAWVGPRREDGAGLAVGPVFDVMRPDVAIDGLISLALRAGSSGRLSGFRRLPSGAPALDGRPTRPRCSPDGTTSLSPSVGRPAATPGAPAAMAPPRISVIIPCYRQAHFLPQCIASLQAQTLQDWEAIVVDDGSPDDTAEVTTRLAAGDLRVRLVRKRNGGLSSARNAGLRAATGDWVQFLDADDLLLPSKLEVHLAQAVGAGPDTIVYGSAWYFKDQDTAQRSRTLLCRADEVDWIDEFAGDPRPMLARLIERNQFPVCSPLVSRQMLARVGEFDESLHAAEDWQMWIQCAIAGARWTYVKHEEAVPMIRVHSASMTQEPGRMAAGVFTLRIKTLRLIQAGPLRASALRHAIDAAQRVGFAGRFRRYVTMLHVVSGAHERLAVGAALLFRPGGLLARRAYRVRARLPADLREIAGVWLTSEVDSDIRTFTPNGGDQ